MNAKEILEEIEAQDGLLQRGWTKVPCHCCKGSMFTRGPDNVLYPCHACRQMGYFWMGPVEKVKEPKESLLDFLGRQNCTLHISGGHSGQQIPNFAEIHPLGIDPIKGSDLADAIRKFKELKDHMD